MTNTTTRPALRVTAVCSFCGWRFDATDNRPGKGLLLPCEDIAGKLCCDACLCDHCGHGHPAAADLEQCPADDETSPADDDFDYDAWTDAIRCVLAGR